MQLSECSVDVTTKNRVVGGCRVQRTSRHRAAEGEAVLVWWRGRR